MMVAMIAMSRTAFDLLVGDALDAVPAQLADLLDNVVVQVAARNAEEPSLLGLYEGVALTERLSDYGAALPDVITIYREAILDICDSEQDARREVTVTVVHELGHHFGIDDARLHELGWG